MEVIWQSDASDAWETAIRLIMDDDGYIMFQYRSQDLPEWTDVDEVPTRFNFCGLRPHCRLSFRALLLSGSL